MRLILFKSKILISICLACIIAIFSIVSVRAIFPRKYYSEILSICEGTSIPPNFVLAIIKTESSFDKDKISSKGAVGLMQIMPETANYVSELYFAGENFDLKSERENILIGVSYLIYLFDKFEDKKTVLSAYNAGEGRVYDWLDNSNYSKDGKTLFNIPFEETDNYVKRVLRFEKAYGLFY